MSTIDNRLSQPRRFEVWILVAATASFVAGAAGARVGVLFSPQMDIPPATTWRCVHKTRKSNYMMDFGSFAFIFRDVVKRPEQKEEWKALGNESWQGDSEHRGSSLISDKLPYTVVSKNNALSVTLGASHFQIKDGGKTLVFGSKTFKSDSPMLGLSKKMFIVRGSNITPVQP